MSCSKIFSGDLPELIYEIIKYFRDDYSTLHSCVLVNRLWCRFAIPLLWENTFSFPTKNYNVVEIYFHNLEDDLKTELNEYKINKNPLPSNTLFNYPSFLKYMNTRKVISSIGMWRFKRTSIVGNRYFSRDNFRKSISMALFKIFIDNEINLHTFEIEINASFGTYCDNVLELILQNPNFIHNIKNLNLSIISLNTQIKNRISQIINSHQNLKKIMFRRDFSSLYQPLLLSKCFNCSNTLNTIIFYYIDFKNINNLDNIFEKLCVLESVHIIYCSGFTQQIINLTRPFKLKSLLLDKRSQIDDSLLLLLQKSGNYLENFGFSSGYNLSLLFKQQLINLFELIPKYSKNIKFLNLCKIEPHINSLIFNLIESIKNNLNYLSIYFCLPNYNVEYISSIILQNLGQILPFKLEYLNLALNINIIDFEIFLKNSQNTFFKKLLINNITPKYCHDIDILPFIKEYIMKKKKVKNLAIKNTFTSEHHMKSGDLSNSKDELEEFKFYNIRVQSYNELFIDINTFIMDID
ncbi:uncharacterized protein OCT59_012696 [Rhizophagus irregularis]|uniref:F-box domain-containing protein n=3 Tax=Rhizophagus irregularis TaxID=588596 RepID=A0A2N1MVB8_9GLOM|nr:hypothetical protein GLOIN_2v1777060 [Rhizophagus irregularis DAOM 181602=DAOM 197198]EXX50656.1 hypothetical protein RirG_268710 [Rhizophagus irregularis DAOM 197198w]PKK65548.1 hypothetical protein RhiirC2_785989 [Rhizophagus irregularis]POG69473.1 hypothetical protein GLOIN_2v1777060 [Rhizophagus irregularis DAOM 181602=DAOM 197198]UZO20270.1 hypothetical protein OCT59_012696 [Rhizophagus irregularis]GBC32247.1 hypothetical protein GLOIN_2v1777060 [Rhizophagus irregularis DAOM 181602=DAO|eukprot:XP_025176339.1 hypothetical protein GLOIN_2v1777060 [Rhizophagus irregularis DAOM 181602=DAOM 197198]